MKRFYCLLTIAFLMLVPAQAQQVTFDEFIQKYQPLKEKEYQFIAEKKYAECIEVLKQQIDLCENAQIVDNQRIVSEEELKSSMGFTYYNMACCYALTGKKKLAIETLRQAIDHNWNNYINLKNDMESGDFVSIAKNKEVIAMLEETRLQQPLAKLQNAGAYCKENADTFPAFQYQSMDDVNLKELRDYFKLDEVAGNGDEISRIKNLLSFCNKLIVHDGSNYAFAELDAIDLYHYHKVTGKGINCRQMATVMMEMYLAMGFKARLVSCMPMASNDYDSHVINCVWSETLNKWLWMDPSFNAWVMDENGNLLSIAEVRERLVDNRPLVLNEEAIHNGTEKQTVDYYLRTYMAKNLYMIACPMKLMFNAEPRYGKPTIDYMQLVPTGFEPYTHPAYTVHDADIFWAAPE